MELLVGGIRLEYIDHIVRSVKVTSLTTAFTLPELKTVLVTRHSIQPNPFPVTFTTVSQGQAE